MARLLKPHVATDYPLKFDSKKGNTMKQHPCAIITGSTSGIGLGIARRLAQDGYGIVLNGFGDQAEIKALREDLARSSNVPVLYHNANMAKADEIEALVTTAFNTFGQIDILVNNAGIQHVAPIDDFPPEKWEAIIAINLVAAFHTIRHTLPHMKNQKHGRIINIASAHALVASPFKSAYCAAKHGIAGLTKAVALEVATQGITVNAICPGYVETPLVKNQIADTAKARGITKEQVVQDIMLGEQATKTFVQIEQVAELAAFLARPDASAITGAMHVIDGGWSAH
jgi:3-hydroxybutyrate dehydrogenase